MSNLVFTDQDYQNTNRIVGLPAAIADGQAVPYQQFQVGIPFFYRVGRYYSAAVNASAPNTGSQAGGVLRAYPWFVSKRIILNDVRTEVTGATAGSQYRVGLYTDANVAPNALIANSDPAVFSGAAIGVRGSALAANITLDPGLYWIAFTCTISLTMRCIPVAAITPVVGGLATLGTNWNAIGYSATFAFGPMPATFPSSSVQTNAACPLIAWRIA